MKRNLFAISLAVMLVMALVFVIAPSTKAVEAEVVQATADGEMPVDTSKILDLNGYNVTVTTDAEITVIDTANTTQDGTTKAGTLTINGNGSVATVSQDPTDKMRYVAIQEGNTYSFHRFNLTISAVGINTIAGEEDDTVAICLRPTFFANDKVVNSNAITDFGICPVVDGVHGEVISAKEKYSLAGKNLLHAYYDMIGSLDEGKIDETKYFCAYMVVNDETVYSSYIAEITPREVLKTINKEELTPTDAQMARLETLFEANTRVANILTRLSNTECVHHGGTATCTAQAVCIDCDTSYGDMLKHSYTTYVSTKKAAVGEDYGYDIYKCTCGATEEFNWTRHILDKVLTDKEKTAISALVPSDIDGNKYSNLNGFANQVYKLAGVDISAYNTKTSYHTRTQVFYGHTDWSTMLVPKSWGGTSHKTNHTLDTLTFEIGDIISGKGNGIYWTAIYQGDGDFLVHNNTTKEVNVLKLAEIFTEEKTWEYYFVMRPDRLTTLRDITTGKLSSDEQDALAALTPVYWHDSLANLKAVAPWFYNTIDVNVRDYITDNIYAVMTNLFTYEKESNLTLKEGNTSNYAKMLVEGYWGSREGTKHGQFTAADFQVGDLFCAKGICADCGKTYYLVAMYQGNGQFLSVVNCSTGASCVLNCNYDTTTFFAEDFFAQTDVATWDYYYVLRPDQLSTIRDISTGKLTTDEKAALSALTPDSWAGAANLKAVGPWFYSTINVDVSNYITDNVYAAMTNLFDGAESNLTLTEGNTSNYAKMLVEGYWGSREGTKHGQFTAADFQVGDLFCAKGICAGCGKTYYLVAMYQGNGQFLSVVNCGGGASCVLGCDYDTTTVFATDFFAQKDVATWDYYFVLRPDQLASAE